MHALLDFICAIGCTVLGVWLGAKAERRRIRRERQDHSRNRFVKAVDQYRDTWKH